MVTIYDVAKRCGVSPSTVSKAINDYPAIPEETKARIKKAMAEMKYVPNLQAKSLSRGKSKNIGILVYMEHEVSPFTHYSDRYSIPSRRRCRSRGITCSS